MSEFEWFVGGRYLGGGGRKAPLSAITVLSTLGVAVGVMVMIVVIAVMSGAETEMEERLLSITAHVVTGRSGGSALDPARTEADLAAIRRMSGVAAVTPYLYTQALLRSPSGIRGAMLRGIDPAGADQVVRLLTRELLTKLSADDAEGGARVPGILLGKVMADELKVREGDIVSLMPTRGAGKDLSIPAPRRFRVAGTVNSGLHEFDRLLAYVTLADAREFLGLAGPTGLEIRVTDVYAADLVAKAVVERMGHPWWAQDWMRTNRNLFSALRLQKVVMFIIMALIVLVAAFNIAATLIMMVMEKTSDIAILKAMGATDRHIRRIFMLKGMLIGGVGTLGGVGLGMALCALLSRYSFIELPTDVYFFSRLPVQLRWLDVTIIVAATLLICLVATLYPARKAARMNPVDALRQG